ncbi:immunoglobulin domain-containing protein [Dyadobacter aurulentus]|uniref:immunoglobulin domain-containing protein n=1 Tax=Dyadobacter sp. UC 10 TaxID=2605428 RepID=UPI0011F32163|nr:hypothetical protein [Dyadobacter sp. UC 10]KAA0993810.1 hypothetical protein FXO21_28325 [Dyadobacter sp. UC 10]
MAQPDGAVYATETPVPGTDGGSVANPANAANSSKNSAAELTASKALLGSATSCSLQLFFTSTVNYGAANPKTVYFRINSNSSAYANGAITITAHNSQGNSVGLVGTGYKTYYAPDGYILIGVTPSASFKSVKLTVASPVLAGTYSANVYFAFYGPGASNSSNPYPFNAADCGRPNGTSIGYSDIILTAFDVSTPAGAIDENLDSKSSFVSNGLPLFGGHIKQTFYFNGKSNPDDVVRLTLSQGGSFLKVNLGSSLTLRAYNGENEVGTVKVLESVLDAALLTSFANNSNITFYFVPKSADGSSFVFDRIELDLNIALLGLGLGANGINVHDVRRVPDGINAPDVVACTNLGEITLSAQALQASINGIGNFKYAWYSEQNDGNLLSVNATLPLLGLTTTGKKTYYVEAAKSGDGCTASPRKKVTVNVQTAPASPSAELNP